jgi:hypothetical protein
VLPLAYNRMDVFSLLRYPPRPGVHNTHDQQQQQKAGMILGLVRWGERDCDQGVALVQKVEATARRPQDFL